MPHLNRVLLLFPLLLLCTSSSPAQHGPPIPVQAHQTAKTLRDLCREYVATGDEYHLDARACLGYVEGAIDALTLAMVNFQFEAKACVLPMATTEDLVRVTLKYIDAHPEKLSYAAADVVWLAMIASYPCPAK
jgi:hypothetical protein